MDASRWRWPRLAALAPVLAGLAVTAALLFFILPQTAEAQCGTQMSSCRNCHEVKAQLKVNTKGEWHTSHAFGDFCATCHGGDAKAKDKEPAHAGMFDPLQNVTAACATCHPADLKDRADRFAKTLGVTAQLGSGAPAAGAPVAAATPSTAQPAPSGSSIGDCGPIAGVAVGDIIDFNSPAAAAPGVNWGNVILVGMILALGAAWFGIAFAGWIQAARKRVAAQAAQRPPAALPAPVSALVPELARCDDETLGAIEALLQKGGAGAQALVAVSRLSPEWLDRARKADPGDLALALSLARKA